MEKEEGCCGRGRGRGSGERRVSFFPEARLFSLLRYLFFSAFWLELDFFFYIWTVLIGWIVKDRKELYCQPLDWMPAQLTIIRRKTRFWTIYSWHFLAFHDDFFLAGKDKSVWAKKKFFLWAEAHPWNIWATLFMLPLFYDYGQISLK